MHHFLHLGLGLSASTPIQRPGRLPFSPSIFHSSRRLFGVLFTPSKLVFLALTVYLGLGLVLENIACSSPADYLTSSNDRTSLRSDKPATRSSPPHVEMATDEMLDVVWRGIKRPLEDGLG